MNQKTVLRQYVVMKKQLNDLVKNEKEMREYILALMDRKETDLLSMGGCKAERRLVVRESLDTKVAREILGDNAPLVEREVTYLKVM